MDKDWHPGERKTPVEKSERKEHVYTPAHEAPRRLPGWWWVPIALLVLIVAAIVFITHHGKDGNEPQTPPELEAQLEAETALMHTEEALATCQSALAAKPNATAVCNVLQVDLNTCRTDLEFTKEKLADIKSDSATAQTTIADAARRICCSQRIENSAINAYDIVDEKIVCVSEGGNAIRC